jgi:hypothetical protein
MFPDRGVEGVVVGGIDAGQDLVARETLPSGAGP